MGSIDKLLDKALSAKKESKYIEFKAEFMTSSRHDWCELVKDIVAMANSGGGVILIGLSNEGTLSHFDSSSLFDLDPAKVTDQIAKFTGEQFSDFELRAAVKGEHTVVAFLISAVTVPMVFVDPGTYSLPDGKQRTAFGKGTIYFRHGAKSEPGNTNDLKGVIERELNRIKKSWLNNIRKVVYAPAGHKVQVLPPHIMISNDPDATPIRIVADENAPAYKLESADTTHPHRQKEVIRLINERLAGVRKINTHDFLCIRRVHKIDNSKPMYYYKPKYSSPQYSDACIDWIVGSAQHSLSFFEEARDQYKQTIR